MFEVAMRKSRSVRCERARLAYSAPAGTTRKRLGTIPARAYRVDFFSSCAQLHSWQFCWRYPPQSLPRSRRKNRFHRRKQGPPGRPARPRRRSTRLEASSPSTRSRLMKRTRPWHQRFGGTRRKFPSSTRSATNTVSSRSSEIFTSA